jgi:hypothetical protein
MRSTDSGKHSCMYIWVQWHCAPQKKQACTLLGIRGYTAAVTGGLQSDATSAARTTVLYTYSQLMLAAVAVPAAPYS